MTDSVEQLTKKTKDELFALCSEANIKIVKKWTKAQIIDAYLNRNNANNIQQFSDKKKMMRLSKPEIKKIVMDHGASEEMIAKKTKDELCDLFQKLTIKCEKTDEVDAISVNTVSSSCINAFTYKNKPATESKSDDGEISCNLSVNMIDLDEIESSISSILHEVQLDTETDISEVKILKHHIIRCLGI